MPGQDAMFEAETLVRLPLGVVRNDEESRIVQARLGDLLGIEACPVAWNGEGFLRLSAQVYNSPPEYDRLAEAVADLLGIDNKSQD